MFFKHRNPHAVEELGNQKLLELIYNVKDSWDHAKETEHAVISPVLLVPWLPAIGRPLRRIG